MLCSGPHIADCAALAVRYEQAERTGIDGKVEIAPSRAGAIPVVAGRDDRAVVFDSQNVSHDVKGCAPGLEPGAGEDLCRTAPGRPNRVIEPQALNPSPRAQVRRSGALVREDLLPAVALRSCRGARDDEIPVLWMVAEPGGMSVSSAPLIAPLAHPP